MMKKICLVQGGDFVLGIDSRSILSRQSGTAAVQSAAERNREVIHLGALLSRQSFETPAPDWVILELRAGKTSFFLLVDQVVDELEVARQPTALPPSSSALAGKLCPAAVVIGNNVVLLLNPARVLPVADQLGNRAGRPAKPLCSDAAGAQKKRPEKISKKAPEKTAAPEPDQSSPGPKVQHKAEPEQAKKRTAPSGTETGMAAAPAECRQKRQQQRRHSVHPAVVNEETFHKVMTWTIAQFSQGKVGHEQITADQLPPELLPKNGVNRKVIQYLIDQIALRCQENKENINQMNRNRPGEQHGG
jgi:hypothetical protein